MGEQSMSSQEDGKRCPKDVKKVSIIYMSHVKRCQMSKSQTP